MLLGEIAAVGRCLSSSSQAVMFKRRCGGGTYSQTSWKRKLMLGPPMIIKLVMGRQIWGMGSWKTSLQEWSICMTGRTPMNNASPVTM